jgi:hypothetical protein
MLIQSLTNLVTGASNAISSLAESASSIFSPPSRTDDELRQRLVALHGVPHDHPINTGEGKIN